MQTAMWLIPIMPFVLAIATTWNFREAFEETVWFNVGYVITLGVIYVMEVTGNGVFSTSPTGAGGAVAMVVGFAALGVRRYQWKKERQRLMEQKALEARRKQREAAAAAARGETTQTKEERSLIVNAFRVAGSMQRARKQARRQARNQQ